MDGVRKIFTASVTTDQDEKFARKLVDAGEAKIVSSPPLFDKNHNLTGYQTSDLSADAAVTFYDARDI